MPTRTCRGSNGGLEEVPALHNGDLSASDVYMCFFACYSSWVRQESTTGGVFSWGIPPFFIYTPISHPEISLAQTNARVPSIRLIFLCGSVSDTCLSKMVYRCRSVKACLSHDALFQILHFTRASFHMGFTSREPIRAHSNSA